MMTSTWSSTASSSYQYSVPSSSSSSSSPAVHPRPPIVARIGGQANLSIMQSLADNCLLGMLKDREEFFDPLLLSTGPRMMLTPVYPTAQATALPTRPRTAVRRSSPAPPPPQPPPATPTPFDTYLDRGDLAL